MKLHSLKVKLLGFIFIIIICIIGTMIFGSKIQFEKYLVSNINNDIIHANEVLADKIDELKKNSFNIGTQLSINPTVIKAIESKDTEKILNDLKPIVENSKIEFITVTDDKGTVLARTHEPQKKGDGVLNQENVKEALEGKANSKVESGTQVKLAARSGIPVKDEQGKIIGVISTGYSLESNEAVDFIKTKLNCEATIFLQDTRISTSILKDGERAVGTKLDPKIAEIVLGNNKYIGEASILGEKYAAEYIPIVGENNKVIGILFTGKSKADINKFNNNFVFNGIFIAVIILIIFSLIIYLYVDKMITRPLVRVVDHFTAVSKGDFTKEVLEKNLARKDEIGDIARGIASMKKELGSLIGNILNNSQELSAISEEFSATLEEFSSVAQNIEGSIKSINSGIHETSAASEQISASMEEVDGSIYTLSGKAMEGSNNANKAKDRTNNLEYKVRSSIGEIDQLFAEKEQNIIKAINEGKIVENIEVMADTIASIAEQTNLLSLNASIEAARAGEHGKGFAVVAEEVRKLAEQSTQSVEAIKDTIVKVQNAFKYLSDNSKDVLEFIKENINPKFNEIVGIGKENHKDAEFVSKMSEELAAMSEEIVATTNQVNNAVVDMAGNTQITANEIEMIADNIVEANKGIVEMTQAAQNQALLAEKLNDMVKVFKF
ncbi:methyl-accepting chemotaxis protein [Clostridium saccharoperbutylacetonicum]